MAELRPLDFKEDVLPQSARECSRPPVLQFAIEFHLRWSSTDLVAAKVHHFGKVEHLHGSFAPMTRAGLLFRNQVIRAVVLSDLARIALGRDIADRPELPPCAWPQLGQLAASLQ